MRQRDVRRLAAQLGIPESQVSRDVLISHVLNALADEGGIIFYGGTALCRTHLPGFRLSEDIDVLVEDDRTFQRALSAMLPGRLSNPYPDASLSWERQEQTHIGRLTGGGLQVQIQVVRLDDSYRRYPTQPAQVELRYPPLPNSVEMTVPTAEAAAAMKLNAWADRSAPRDLIDLWALDREGHLTREAVRIADEVAPGFVQPYSFGDDVEPSEQEWRAALAAQMPDLPDPRAVLHEVRASVAVRKGWRQGDRWKLAAEAFAEVDADDHR